jgi:hypothetical protein
LATRYYTFGLLIVVYLSVTTPPVATPLLPSDPLRLCTFVGLVRGVSLLILGIECRSIILRQWETLLNPVWQIRIRDEPSSIYARIDVAIFNRLERIVEVVHAGGEQHSTALTTQRLSETCKGHPILQRRSALGRSLGENLYFLFWRLEEILSGLNDVDVCKAERT